MSGDKEWAGGGGYLWRRITPRQAEAVSDAMASGATAKQLAAQYGVCVRTIWRAVKMRKQRLVTVRIDAWQAEYVVGDDGPVRVSPWYAA